MIEQKKKLRLDELKVDSFVTTTIPEDIKSGTNWGAASAGVGGVLSVLPATGPFFGIVAGLICAISDKECSQGTWCEPAGSADCIPGGGGASNGCPGGQAR